MHEEGKTENEENDAVHLETSSPIIMLRSDLAQEIISRRSGFVENWALPIFLLILTTLFACSWFVHYPDSISAIATIHAESSPVQIIAPRDAIITKLIVKNGENVKRNHTIAWLDSSGDHAQVIALLTQVDKAIALLSKGTANTSTKIISENYNDLGEVQGFYNQFLNLNNPTSYKDGLQTLKYRLTEWMNIHTVKAPINGIMSFSGPLQTGQNLTKGSILGYIIPNNKNFYADAIITQSNLAKIDTGMLVQLKLDAYPYQEWGLLQGKISCISSILSPEGVKVTIMIAPDFISTDKKKITLRNGLSAEIAIIAKDVRLFQKFYSSFISSTSLDK